MRRSGVPTMSLVVMGDWETVISVWEYREVLLDQAPCDEEDRKYSVYRIECETMADFVTAYAAFAAKKVNGEIQFDWQTEDCGVLVHVRSGWAGDGRRNVDVMVNESTSVIEAAAKRAVEILTEALR